MTPLRLAIVTVSDAAARGDRVDTSGDAVASWATGRDYRLADRGVLADDEDRLRDRLAELAARGDVDLIITTGGTGFTERDVTPEATRAVIHRDAPGIAEALRYAGSRSTPYAWLSRGVAGIRGRTLIVNLPGSTSGVTDGLRILEDFVDHAVQLLRGHQTGHHPGHG